MPVLQTLLCAFDYSAASRSALVQAADLAEREHAALHLLHVTPLFRARHAHAGTDPEAAFQSQAHDFVDEVLGAEGAFEVIAPTVHESTGVSPADGILHYAAEVGADLIVVGTHGRRGLNLVLTGSVAAETLRRSPVPVLVVPERAEETAPQPDRPVLAAVDFSDHSGPALVAARRLAGVYGAPLAIAHVRDVPAETLVDLHASPHGATSAQHSAHSREDAHADLDALVADTGLDPQAVEQYVVPGRPAPGLVDLAHQARAGLLVVGTHGRRGWDRLRLGSVAEGVVQQAPCPVLVVPAPRPESDVSGSAASASAT